ncbi:GatB/GatE catalytic domain-containing protein [Bisporella sp. PMI_857]|nr:GatB/GatE catalytic domain-containing protein [Bisporella sp. PMI_857]
MLMLKSTIWGVCAVSLFPGSLGFKRAGPLRIISSQTTHCDVPPFYSTGRHQQIRLALFFFSRRGQYNINTFRQPHLPNPKAVHQRESFCLHASESHIHPVDQGSTNRYPALDKFFFFLTCSMRIPTPMLRKYLLEGRFSTTGCLSSHASGRISGQRCYAGRTLYTDAGSADPNPNPTIPFRKQLKDEAKLRKAQLKKKPKRNPSLEKWELTVGIEIHAQLNTPRKLFSAAASTINDAPNTRVALFDMAMPGSQPIFQKETLIPAIRAALALNCNIQNRSKFDRKHYFHWDQPSGYQITQYYEPFAKNGYIELFAHDGIAKEDADNGPIRIGIKQVQMEQDTAKTSTQPGGVHLLDFNRSGLPLIEIITLPEFHHPETAAAFVKKIQILLNAVDACVLGMESGGLRADVNVSVRERHRDHEGGRSLGQRTEIKNLSSFKAVEDAIIAERDRQIELLEAGGIVEGETRGWTIGSTETVRLRGKEGEVDYRYMPDPDLAPVFIGDKLIQYLKSTMGVLPHDEIDLLASTYSLTMKDAKSLVSLDNGYRAEYFRNVVDYLVAFAQDKSSGTPEEQQMGLDQQGKTPMTQPTKGYQPPEAQMLNESALYSPEMFSRLGKLAGNWVLHEVGAVIAGKEDNYLEITYQGFSRILPHTELAKLIHYLDTKRITGRTAKYILSTLLRDDKGGNDISVEYIVEKENLWFIPLTETEYVELALKVFDEKIVAEILNGKEGKINYLVGQMMQQGEKGKVDAEEATRIMKREIERVRNQASA